MRGAHDKEERYWHLSLFAARLGLAAIILVYIALSGGVAQGGLGIAGLLSVIVGYLLFTGVVAIASRGNELTPRLRRAQTLLDNLALVIGTPHDPGIALPVAFFLAINPLEFGVRYGLESYRYSVLAAIISTLAIVAARSLWFTPGLTLEAVGLLFFTWAAIAYGLLTVYGMARLRSDVERGQQSLRDSLLAIRAAAANCFPDADKIYFEGDIDALLGRDAAQPLTSLAETLRYIHKDDRSTFNAEMMRVLRDGAASDFNYRVCRGGNGETHWFRQISRPLHDATGAAVGVRGIMIANDTEMQAREVLTQLIENRQMAMRSVGFATWSWNLHGTVDNINPELDALLGQPPGTYDGKLATFFDLIHPDDRAHVQHTMQMGAQSGEGFEGRFRVLLRDGEIRWLASRGEPLEKDADGSATHVIGVVWDVTAEMQAANELIKLRERHDLSLRSAGVGTWTWHVEADHIETDPYVEALFNVPAGSFDGSVRGWQALLHPEDRNAAIAELAGCLRTQKAFESDYRVPQPDGSLRWLKTRGEPTEIDADGHVVRVGGAIWNITNEILARREADKTLQRVEAAMLVGNLVFWQIDIQAQTLDYDSAGRRAGHGPPPGPLPLDYLYQHTHPENREHLRSAIKHCVQHGERMALTYRWHQKSSGQYIYLYTVGAPTHNSAGEITGVAGVSVDQTKLVQAQQQTEAALARVDEAAESGCIGFWSLDAASGELDLDKNWRRIAGYPADAPQPNLEEALELVVPEDREKLRSLIQQMLKDATPLEHLYCATRADTGEVRNFQIRGRAQRGADGQIVRISGHISDQTEITQRQAQLDAMRERYERGMQTAEIGNWTVSLDTQTIEIDKTLADILGIDFDTFDGRLETIYDLYLPEDRHLFAKAITQGLANQEQTEFKLRRRMPNGQLRWFCTRGAILPAKPGEPRTIAGATWDITEIAKLNAALARSNQDLTDFAHIASHDLREPLRGLHNYAKFLAEDYAELMDDEGKRMLFSLGRLAQRLDNLIADLLHFSRVSRSEMAMQETDINAVVHDVLETLEFSLQEMDIDIRIPVPLPSVVCDPVRVGELFRNLITNAAKYNDKDEKWIEIGHNCGVFHVRDNGIGIAPELQERVFTIFKRLHPRDAFGGGTGAGLAIAKQIAERHGGWLWLESSPGEGTTFFFTLEMEEA